MGLGSGEDVDEHAVGQLDASRAAEGTVGSASRRRGGTGRPAGARRGRSPSRPGAVAGGRPRGARRRGRDVEREQGHVLALERAAQVVGRPAGAACAASGESATTWAVTPAAELAMRISMPPSSTGRSASRAWVTAPRRRDSRSTARWRDLGDGARRR